MRPRDLKCRGGKSAAEVQPVNAAESKLARIHTAVSGKRGKLADTIRAILGENGA